MGRVISKDLFSAGFTYRYDDGREEHFYPALFGGYKAIRYDGHTEMAKI